ncbi:hypothetical protein GGS20DRAFT_531330 [Poronia punctata]|nr:hypothetical protein GGS20DRAFT_531330 [Poronia punctata]
MNKMVTTNHRPKQSPETHSLRMTDNGGKRVAAPTRQKVIAICPGLQASPTEVRDWFAVYLAYRGIPSSKAHNFFWRGVELHRANYASLVDAFKQHCGTLEWEAEILAYDVFTIVEGSIPPPERTVFQVYVESVFGYDYYMNLMQWTRPNTSLLDYANCAFCWLGFSFIHLVLLLITAVIIGFLTST